jgi:hypothetical protein
MRFLQTSLETITGVKILAQLQVATMLDSGREQSKILIYDSRVRAIPKLAVPLLVL